MYPVHEDVGRSLAGVFDFLQEWFDVLAVDIVSASLALGLQNEALGVFNGHFVSFVAFGSLRKNKEPTLII